MAGGGEDDGANRKFMMYVWPIYMYVKASVRLIVVEHIMHVSSQY